MLWLTQMLLLQINPRKQHTSAAYAPYETQKEMHPTVPYLVSGISGTLYGYLAAKTNLGGDIIKALVSGDPIK